MLCETLCEQYYIHISVTITIVNTKEPNIDFTMNYVFSVHKKDFFSVKVGSEFSVSITV